MQVLEGVGIALLALLLALAVLFGRRRAIARGGGTIHLSLRLTTLVPGRGWATGVGRFVGDELRWYRMFSFSIRPRKVLHRHDLAVARRRAPDERERMVLPGNWTIVCCTNRQGTVEIAMALGTLAGFLSWIEASPPGVIPNPPSWPMAG
ncbi:MAG: DUF2550 domain-containing protein [Dactylosporangium sp.]|nr:DUF2550 domain-containing protein [Dactylosporangium sp.]NNJ60816.1 DUF2550 domain-containing protein [Dactylosporangium sp.]